MLQQKYERESKAQVRLHKFKLPSEQLHPGQEVAESSDSESEATLDRNFSIPNPDKSSTQMRLSLPTTAKVADRYGAQWAQRPTFLAKSQSRSLMHYKVKKGVVF